MHLIGDLLQSVGVIIAAIVIIYEPSYLIVDPICTFLFSVLVMFTTIPTFIKCMKILMEQTPCEIRVDHLRAGIMKIPHVSSIEDFHVWALAGDKYFMSAHIKVDFTDSESVGSIRKINQRCQELAQNHNVCHATFEIN